MSLRWLHHTPNARGHSCRWFVPDNGKINILDTQYNARNSSGFGIFDREYTSGGSVNVGAGLMPADFSKVEK